MPVGNKRILNRELSVVDLFCGIGGLSHGLQQSGLKIIAGVDSDPLCKYAFSNNTEGQFICTQAENINSDFIANLYDKDSIRVLAGCAPCQPFSTYSRRKVPGANANSDTRWSLLYTFSDLISQISPDIVTMENVSSLKTFQQGKVLDDFVSHLENQEYSVSVNLVYCPDYGIPQKRRRLVLLASRFGPISMIAPSHSPENYLTVRGAIGHLPELSHGQTDFRDPLHRASRLSKLNLTRIRNSIPGGSWRDWDVELRADCHLKKSGKSYPSVYGRMEWDAPSPTLTTQFFGFGNGRFGHPEQDRAISLREAALLQTFPNDYEFVPKGHQVSMKHLGRHIGNAVPPLLGRAIGGSIINHVQNDLSHAEQRKR